MSLSFRFPLCPIFTPVSCALLICVWLLHQYLVNFFIFRLVRLLRKYHADFFFPCSPNCHVGISCAYSFPFCPIATLVSRALFVFPIVQSLRYYLVGLCFLVRLLRKYLVHFLFSCLSNCFVFILCAFCFRSCPIFTVISRALFVFFLVQMQCYYHRYFFKIQFENTTRKELVLVSTFSKIFLLKTVNEKAMLSLTRIWIFNEFGPVRMNWLITFAVTLLARRLKWLK